MKFKSDIELQAGLKDGSNDIGTAGQILSSTGSQTNWIDQSSIVASEAKLVFIECKNTSGGTISKGTPVYQTGTVGATDVIEVGVADASDENKMAAIGLLQTDLANNAFGKVVITGELLNITTSPIDGVTPVTGDTIYVKSGGGLTLTKPTGVNFIQNIGLVGKVSGGSAGSITVSSIMRSNDVPTPLYVDHTNQRLGIGVESPARTLQVNSGGANIVATFESSDTLSRISFVDSNTSSDAVVQIGADGNELVLFAGGAEHVRVDSSGNVGIGTTNPSTKLEVISAANEEGIAIKDTSGNLKYKVRQFGGNTYSSFWNSSNTEQVRINSSGTSYFNGGNIGIGTSSPAAKLDVRSTASNYVATFKHSTGTGYAPGSILLEAGQGNARGQGIYHYNNVADENWFTGVPYNVDSKKWIVANKYSTTQDVDTAQLNYALLTIDSDTGNVGIGTTSPLSKLHLKGGTNVNLQIGSVGTELQIKATNDADSAYVPMILRASEYNILNGNVGIGTASPSEQLHVYNAGHAKVEIEGGANEDASLMLTETGSTGFRFNYDGGDNKLFIGSGTAGTFNTKLTIERDSGNVGIGTTSPGSKLNIASAMGTAGQFDGAQLRLDTTDAVNTTGFQGMRFQTSTVTNYGWSMGANRSSGGRGSFRFYEHNNSATGTERLTILQDGNIGIGATSPRTKLHVDSSTAFSLTDGSADTLLLTNDSTVSAIGAIGPSIGFGNMNNNNRTSAIATVRTGGDHDNMGLAFFTHPSDSGDETVVQKMTITHEGNVGIGTTSPTRLLSISNSDTATTPQLLITQNGAGDAVIGFNRPGHQGWAMGIDSSIGNNFEIHNSSGGVDSSSQLAITPAGKVGIGTTSPTAPLDVNGVIRSRGGSYSANTDTRTDVGLVIPENDFIYTADGSDYLRKLIGKNNDVITIGESGTSLIDGINLSPGTTGGYVQILNNNSIAAKFVDGKLGIGTTSPEAKLHVDSENLGTTNNNTTTQAIFSAVNANASKLYIQDYRTADGSDWTTSGKRIQEKINSTWMGYVQFNGDSNNGGVSFGTGTNSTQGNVAERMRITSGGNVGIGTTSPSRLLDVDGVQGWSLNNAEVAYLNPTSTGTDFALKTSGTTVIRLDGRPNADSFINNGGNVGIGTTTPGHKLEVYATGDSLSIGNNSNTQTYMRFANSRTMVGYGGANAVIQAGSGKGINFNVNNDSFNSGTAATITSTGNVGIGTTSPRTKLHITGLSGDDDPTLGSSTAPFFVSNTASSYGLNIGVDVNGTSWLQSQSNTSATAYKMSLNPLGGNVGIGTTSPSHKLEVGLTSSVALASQPAIPLMISNNGNPVDGRVLLQVKHDTVNTAGAIAAGYQMTAAAVTSGTASYYDSLIFLESAGSNSETVHSAPKNIEFYVNNYNTAAGAGTSYTALGNLAFELQADGDAIFYDNVGIGTTSPSSKLHVNYEDAESVLTISRGGTNLSAGTAIGTIQFNADYQGSPISYGSIDMYANSLSGVRSSLDFNVKSTSGGIQTGLTVQGNSGTPRVGIGTTSPGAKLEVNGNVAINSTGLTEGFQWFNDTNEIFSLEDTSGAGELLLLSSNSVKVVLNANGDSYFNGGNVGINNTSPVNGKLVVTSTEEDLLNTVRIQHTRSNSNFGSKALEIDMNLSGADTTTADRTNRGIYVDLDSSADGDAANEHRIHGIESDVRFTGFSDIVRAGQFYAESNNITEKTAQLVGVYGQAVHDAGNAAGGVSNMIGAYGYSSIQDLGDVDNAFGVYGLVDIGDNRGNADVGVTKAVEGEISINKASTISYGTMIGISSIIDNNEGSVPNFGNQYLFKGDYQGTRGNNAWGIYTEGDKNYFEGNVGIGITSPGYKLDVSGDARFTGNVTANNLSGTSANFTGSLNVGENAGTGEKHLTVGNGRTGNGYSYIDLVGDATYTDFGLRIIRNNSGANTTSQIVHRGTGDFSIQTTEAANLTFRTSSSEKMRITSAGNVGIGTDSPASKLHIDSGATDEVLRLEGTGSPYLSFYDTGVRQSYIGSFGNTLQIHADTPDTNIAFYTEGTHRAIIDSSGNLGIGTTSPSAKLEVNGDIGIGRVAGGYTFRETVGGGERASIKSNATNELIFSYGASTEAMRINSSGNVGIGTTSPGKKLDVAGDWRFDGITGGHFENYTYGSQLDISELTSGGWARANRIATSDSDAYVFSGVLGDDTTLTRAYWTIGSSSDAIGYTYSNGIILLKNGNVGIGTTSPRGKLDIVGNTDDDADFLTIQDNDPSAGSHRPSIRFRSNTAQIGQILGLDNSMRFSVGTTEDSLLEIASGGNVGIGTTSPSDKLHVNGTVRSQAPTTSDWAVLGYNSSGNAASGLWFDNGDGELLLRDDSGNLNVRLRSDSSSYINGGNLGLGTTSPGQKLTVNSGRVLISNTTTPIYIKAGSAYKSWVHHIGGGDEYIFAPSTADNGETWDWSNQTRFDTSGVVRANNFVLASDKRLKTNIKNVSGKQIKANWKTFEMIADKTKAQRHGVIAQELEEVHPEFVRTDNEGIKSVAYTDLLIAKIAELEARLEKLEK